MKYKLGYLVEPYFYNTMPDRERAAYFRSFKIRMLEDFVRHMIDKNVIKMQNRICEHNEVLPDGVLTGDEAINYDVDTIRSNGERVAPIFRKAMDFGTKIEAEFYVFDKEKMEAIKEYVRVTAETHPDLAKALRAFINIKK